MAAPLLTTKFHIPPPRPDLVPHPHLIRRLDQSLRPGHRLTLISAPAGFDKTTLVNMVTGWSVGDVGDACTWGAGTGGSRRWRPATVVPGGHAG